MSETENDHTVDSEAAGGGEVRTPPYFAYRTFLTFLGDLKEHGIPHQIDRSALKRFPGGVISQLLMGCRSLGLTNGDNRPTQRLADMVSAHETERFKPLLAAMLRDTYPFLFRMDLTTATPAMFADAMRSNSGGKGEEVQAKCRRFFLQAAQAADIEVGKRLIAGTGRSSAGGSTAKRKAKATSRTKDDKPPGGSAGDGKPEDAVKTPDYMEALLAKFPAFDPAWPDPIKEKWFAGFEQFMKKAAKQ